MKQANIKVGMVAVLLEPIQPDKISNSAFDAVTARNAEVTTKAAHIIKINFRRFDTLNEKVESPHLCQKKYGKYPAKNTQNSRPQ